MRERFDMYIVTYEKFDQQMKRWEKKFDFLETGVDVQESVEYLVEREALGLIRNIRIWDVNEITYKKKVEIKVNIAW